MLYAMLTGRIGKDGDLRYLATGTPILVVSVATDTGFGDRKKTVWVKCNVWGKRGESLAPYIKKGGEISLVGELSESEWVDKEGVAKKNLEMDVKEIQLVGGKPDISSQSAQTMPNQAKPVPNNGQQAVQTLKDVVNEMAQGFSEDMDDIPFAPHERFLL